jgi:ABC-type bacteriocin/lantibiotic exporter with double-glycine peptidase domain
VGKQTFRTTTVYHVFLVPITHDLSMIPDEAMVLELHEGRIANQGTCLELRVSAGWFQEQWQAQ